MEPPSRTGFADEIDPAGLLAGASEHITMKRPVRILFGAVVIVVVILGVALARVPLFKSRQVTAPRVRDLPVNASRFAEVLSRAVRLNTISSEDPIPPHGSALLGLHALYRESFPLVHAKLRREVINGYSLLYTWQGANPSLPPVILMGHQDVVPIDDPGAWSEPPFGGRIVKGFVWGRGTLDDKIAVLGVLQGAETLLAKGYRPQRTIYFAFGHDEEISGEHGARAIARELKRRGVRAAFVLDEGGAITKDVVGGLKRPLAVVGIAEKGYVSLELSVKMEGGHSSMPPGETAVGAISAAVSRLEQHPFPAHVDGVSRQMLEYIGPEMSFAKRVALANLWLTGPVVARELASEPATNAGLRTTTAPTVISGGVKDNVLPKTASAIVNFRILPGDTISSVKDRVISTIDDRRVQVRVLPFGSEPSAVSDTNSPGFRAIQKTIAQVFPDALVAPSLVLGATDSRHFKNVSSQIYRFLPVTLTEKDLARIHGSDERIAVSDCPHVAQFYAQLIRNACSN
jgi:carboxypeptidase PM20D1